MLIRDGFPDPVGRFPLQAQGGDLFLVGEVAEVEGVTASAEEELPARLLVQFIPGAHVGVDEGALVVIPAEGVEKKESAVVGPDPELVEPGVGCKKGSGPADGETLLVDLFGRNPCSPVEVDGGIDPFEDVLLFLVHLLDVEIAAPQTAFGLDGLWPLEGLDEICR